MEIKYPISTGLLPMSLIAAFEENLVQALNDAHVTIEKITVLDFAVTFSGNNVIVKCKVDYDISKPLKSYSVLIDVTKML